MKKIIIRIIGLLAAIGVLAGAGIFTAVSICAHKERQAVPSDCIIVLGARVWPDGGMSKSLLYRCRSALEAWKRGVAENIIVCGAQGSDEPATEASVMRAYFLEQGVPEENVFAEDQSFNTKENLKNAKAIMDEHGWTTAAVVTNDYHVERSLWIARDVGIDTCGIAAPPPDRISTQIISRLRESASWVFYVLRKVF